MKLHDHDPDDGIPWIIWVFAALVFFLSLANILNQIFFKGGLS